MARKKISTTVYFNPGQLDDLKALSDKDRVPTAVLIRAALDAYLAGRRLEIPARAPDPRQEPMDYGPATSAPPAR